jgi:plasmid maintenance system antidote protein VapI
LIMKIKKKMTITPRMIMNLKTLFNTQVEMRVQVSTNLQVKKSRTSSNSNSMLTLEVLTDTSLYLIMLLVELKEL